MSKKIPQSRTSMGIGLELKNCEGHCGDLITIKTSSKKEAVRKIKIDIKNWVENAHFNGFRDKKFDLAIVSHVNKNRMERQDVDNIAKVVMDALKKNEKDDFKPDVFLFNDDSQVVRLLVYKIPREELENSNTDELMISFREHDPGQQMELVEINEY